jgi:uncharacterized damage-inducible protein DinB
VNQDDVLRALLARLLDWEDAHVGFDAAVERIPPELRGLQPDGLPHSAWQLLEHLRLCQLDILEFCRNPTYVELKPEDYWPRTAAPPTGDAWDQSVAEFRRDREAVKQLAVDPKVDLFAVVPNGTNQTYLRELLLVADHNAYHVGQLVALRRLLGVWPSS